MLQVLPADLSIQILIKSNAPELHDRTSCQVNGRGAKDKEVTGN